MFPLLIAILLFVIGLVLLGAEFFIPAHGVTAGLGLLALLAGVIACFFESEWLGIGALATGAVVAPVGAAGLVRLFPRTRLGRRFILPPPSPVACGNGRVSHVRIGQRGIAVSELRPSGMCEFDDLCDNATDDGTVRIEAVSDFGEIAAGSRVRVICVTDGRATVRQA